MSWASSINTETCFERHTFNQPLAARRRTRRRTLERSNSSPEIPTHNNMASRPSRAQSTSPAPSIRSLFKTSKCEKSNQTPHPHLSISAPILISSTNPLVTIKNTDSIPSVEGLDEKPSRSSVRISEILAHYEEESDDEEEEVDEDEEDVHATRLSPTPPLFRNKTLFSNKPLPQIPCIVKRRSHESLLSQIQIQYPQPRSHFSEWSMSSVDDDISRDSSPVDSTFSRRESVASIYSDDTLASSVMGKSFEYNPYISQVATRGFQKADSDEVSPASPPSDLGLL